MCCVKLQVPTSKTQRSSKSSNANQSLPTSLGVGAWNFSGAWGLVLTVAAGSNVAIPETVHLVMRAVARASLCNRNRSMPTAPRNSDIRRNSGLRNSKSPAVVFLRITVFSLQNSRDRSQCASNFAVVVTRTIRPQEQSDPRNNPTPGTIRPQEQFDPRNNSTPGTIRPQGQFDPRDFI